MIIDLEPKYRTQFDRMMRWYHKFDAIQDGSFEQMDDFIDLAYAFFMNCYHLKDWLINDEEVRTKISKNEIESYVTDNMCLSICADICNASKHLVLTSKPRSGSEEIKLEPIIYKNTGEPFNRYWWFIETDEDSIELFELATICVERWKDFIKKHELKGAPS